MKKTIKSKELNKNVKHGWQISNYHILIATAIKEYNFTCEVQKKEKKKES